MPNVIARILDWPWFPLIARIVLTFPFWGSGISKTIDFQGAVAEMQQFGLKPPVLIALLVIFTQLGGSLLVIANRRTWSGAGALAIFTLLTIPIAHDFWNLKGDAAKQEFYFAVEHISVVGGLMLAAILSRYSPRKGA
ncbi:MAG: DoxX family protein [Rhizobiales bacterium]|nr:DoxX family protein [Hyphomicrobiales bacterium]